MAASGCRWLVVFACGGVWLYLAAYGCAWLYITIYGCIAAAVLLRVHGQRSQLGRFPSPASVRSTSADPMGRRILETKQAMAADVIVMSEVKAISSKPPASRRVARENGLNLIVSEPSPLHSMGRQRAGGTVTLWRRTVGRVSTHRGTDHQSTGTKIAELIVASIYGPQNANA